MLQQGRCVECGRLFYSLNPQTQHAMCALQRGLLVPLTLSCSLFLATGTPPCTLFRCTGAHMPGLCVLLFLRGPVLWATSTTCVACVRLDTVKWSLPVLPLQTICCPGGVVCV